MRETLKQKIKSLFPWMFVAANIERLQAAVARVELRQIRAQNSPDPKDWEFRASSQFGEDGLLQFILTRIQVPRPVFVEFGVEDYKEANTRFLLQHDRWSGLVLDGSGVHVDAIRRDPIYWRCNLKAEQAFVTRENINEILQKNGLSGDIGLLSVDIDGNDYWVWEAITAISPRVVIVEFNALFGPTAAVTVPYDPAFVREKAHSSRVYFGASLAAFDHLASRKGYALVEVESNGVNAFFVRNDVANALPRLQPGQAWRERPIRESRDASGSLDFLPSIEQLRSIGELPVIDVRNGSQVKVRDAVKTDAFILPQWP